MNIKLKGDSYICIGYGSEWTKPTLRLKKTPLGWDLLVGKVFISYDNFNPFKKA
jgi:hypothetical protein